MKSFLYNLTSLLLNIFLIPLDELFSQKKTDNRTNYQVKSKQKHDSSAYLHDNTPAMLCSFP